VTSAHAADDAEGFAKPGVAYAPLVLAVIFALPIWAAIILPIRALLS
jgi:hypothetical protein